MIAACPKCHTRYRVQPDQLGPEGARLRCSQCNAVFRVRLPAPASPAPASDARVPEPERAATEGPVEARREVSRPEPSPTAPAGAEDAAARRGAPPAEAEEAEAGPRFDRERLVLVAHADPDACKEVAEALEGWGLQVLVAHDGVEAVLAIQRALPRVVVLHAALPKMFGFQVCELVKRNESLRTIQVVLVGAIHREERYRRAPSELYGADAYVEPHALPDSLYDPFVRFGLPVGPARHGGAPQQGGAEAGRLPSVERSQPIPTPAAPRPVARPAPPLPEPAPSAGRGAAPAREPVAPSGAVPAAAAPPAADDAWAAERAKAERLARIIVSDIILYNQEKFDEAIRRGAVVEAMQDELAEGRSLFRERIHAQVRDERDFLADELRRVALTRGTR